MVFMFVYSKHVNYSIDVYDFNFDSGCQSHSKVYYCKYIFIYTFSHDKQNGHTNIYVHMYNYRKPLKETTISSFMFMSYCSDYPLLPVHCVVYYYCNLCVQ